MKHDRNVIFDDQHDDDNDDEEVQYINLDPFVYQIYRALSVYARIPHTCISLFEKCMFLLSTKRQTNTLAPIFTYAHSSKETNKQATQQTNNKIDDSNCDGKKKKKINLSVMWANHWCSHQKKWG